MKNPPVQVVLKKKSRRVKKPDMLPMPRNMTVLQAIAQADNYNEIALLDEIRIIRGNL